MRRLLCVLFGVVLVVGAVSMFSVRQGGWEAQAHAYSGSSRWALERSVGEPYGVFNAPSEPRSWLSDPRKWFDAPEPRNWFDDPSSWFSSREPRGWFGDDRRQAWLNVANGLDMLNLLVGIAGICLVFSGMRAGRRTAPSPVRKRAG